MAFNTANNSFLVGRRSALSLFGAARLVLFIAGCTISSLALAGEPKMPPPPEGTSSESAPRRPTGPVLSPPSRTTPEQVARPRPSLAIAAIEESPQLAAIRNRRLSPIDLSTAFALAGVRNPEILLAQQRVAEAMALRQLAAVQYLPTINLGTSFDNHTGNLQQSSGNILSVNRNALYVGAGANAIAAGTVNIPGVVWNLNVTDAIYAALVSRQIVRQRAFDSQAMRNNVELRVAIAYLNLLEAVGLRSVQLLIVGDASEIARLTANYAKTGQGTQADADRAATELRDREARVIKADALAVRASAQLSALLGLDPDTQLQPRDNWIVPHPIVPAEMPLPELIATALLRRPEMESRRAAIRAALLSADGARALPFSPTMLIGFSAGDFGGGSNLVNQPVDSSPFAAGAPRFGNFDVRTDFDVLAYWTLRNMGVGNRALIESAQAGLRTTDLQLLDMLDHIRAQVADAYVRSHARYAQIHTAEEAILNGIASWQEDLRRIRAAEGLPIEVLDSMRLLARARNDYLKAIMSFNRSQFELYVALGRPPADMLARPVDAGPLPMRNPAPEHPNQGSDRPAPQSPRPVS